MALFTTMRLIASACLLLLRRCEYDMPKPRGESGMPSPRRTPTARVSPGPPQLGPARGATGAGQTSLRLPTRSASSYTRVRTLFSGDLPTFDRASAPIPACAQWPPPTPLAARLVGFLHRATIHLKSEAAVPNAGRVIVAFGFNRHALFALLAVDHRVAMGACLAGGRAPIDGPGYRLSWQFVSFDCLRSCVRTRRRGLGGGLLVRP